MPQEICDNVCRPFQWSQPVSEALLASSGWEPGTPLSSTVCRMPQGRERSAPNANSMKEERKTLPSSTGQLSESLTAFDLMRKGAEFT